MALSPLYLVGVRLQNVGILQYYIVYTPGGGGLKYKLLDFFLMLRVELMQINFAGPYTR